MAVNFYSEVHFADNVGIGTTSPSEKLEVDGNVKLSGNLNVGGYIHPNDENGNLSIYGGNNTTNDAHILLHGDSNYWGSLELNYGYDATNSFLKISQGSNEHLRITNGGKVGIGTTSPGEKLDVAGDIKLSGDIELGHASDTTIARASAGKVTIEGQPIQTKQMSMTHHNFFMNSSSTSADFFIPFNNLNESSNPTNTQYYNRMVAPYDGRIVKVVLNTTAAIGTSCQVLFWVANSISGVFAPSASETVTGVNLNTANSHAVATFSTSSTAEFNEGDVLGVSIIKSSSSTANMQVTVVWEYTV